MVAHSLCCVVVEFHNFRCKDKRLQKKERDLNVKRSLNLLVELLGKLTRYSSG